MKGKSFLVPLYLLAFFHQCSWAQDLSFFVLGEATFKNKDIYSIHQTDQGALYVGTDQGLYAYQNYKMRALENDIQQRGTAVFNLTSNTKGEVFCSNLNGQVFKVERNRLVLIHQMSYKDIGTNVNIFIDGDNGIIVVSKSVISLNYDSTSDKWISKILYDYHPRGTLKGLKTSHDGILLYNLSKDSILRVKNGEQKWLATPLIKRQNPLAVELLIPLEKSLYSTNYLDSILSSPKRQKIERHVYRKFGQNVWRRGIKSGLSRVSIKSNQPYVVESYFKNLFISAIFENNNGVLFLGTFGKGLYVIPDKTSFTYPLEPQDNVQSMAVTPNGETYVSDIKNGIIAFNKNEQQVLLKGEKTNYIPEKLFSLKNFEKSILSDHPDIFFNDGRFKAAIKSIFQIDNSTILLAGSGGIQRWGKTTVTNEEDWVLFDEKNDIYVFAPLTLRCKDVVYDKANETLYIATQNALFLKSKNEPVQEILKNGNSLVVNDLEWRDNQLWCATQSYGVLVFKNRGIVGNWNTENGLGSNFVTKLKFANNQLYVQHKSGFQIRNGNSGTWKFLGKPEGIPSGRVRDFAVGETNIWFLSENAIISKKIDYVQPDFTGMEVIIDSVLVSNQKQDFTDEPEFDYAKNKLEIFFRTLDFFYDEEAILTYTLNGLDQDWKTIPLREINTLKYEYLPPGDYDFKSRILVRGKDRQLEGFSFSIAPVFYKTWWFLVIMALGIAAATWIVFRLKSKREKAKSIQKLHEQQLKMDLAESNLRALRAQMNPHFIFNSLNAIQSLILKKNTEASYDYIVLFSELVRNALEYSELGSISLMQELDFLDTYLKLEKLRFGDSLEYAIKGEPLNKVKIPSLMIQPFVENALVHGLFHKSGLKKLEIHYEVKRATVHFLIKDNGIGRKKAQEITKRQNPNHQSFAFQAIKKRMAIMRQQGNSYFDFRVQDIYKENRPVGTHVTMVLPRLS